MSRLVFLKLGGSLITDKSKPHTAHLEVLARLAQEIATAMQAGPDLSILLGHGSGSFGHVPARQYGTRLGVRTPDEWRGFIEVWREAAALNRLVMDALRNAGLPAIAFPPSTAITTRDHTVRRWDLAPLTAALGARLIPVVFGDVVFDETLGGTILSTEELFEHLAIALRPRSILLAGLEPGVWADYPACTMLVGEITPKNWEDIVPGLGGSAGVDVTGGMLSKVSQSLALAQRDPLLEVQIFSGEESGQVKAALSGARVGTAIHATAAS